MPPKPPVEMTLDAELLDLMLRVGSRWVLWLLLALSMFAMAVVLERIWFFFQERRPAAKLDALAVILATQGPAAALKSLGGVKSMEGAVALAALRHIQAGPGTVQEQISATLERERLRYERMLAFLGTLGSNAPFIGLFGTVLGIIRAFHDLAMNTAQGAQAVMAGIAEALVATAVGLLVALPAVATYNLFARHVEACAAGAMAIGHTILAFAKARSADDKEPVVNEVN